MTRTDKQTATLRNEKGEYDKYAWPGLYPIYYVTDDNCALCADCANNEAEVKKAEEQVAADPEWRGAYAQWLIVAADVNWEDTELYCDHCNKRIESAYTEDEKEAE
jgi:hypothetical protein